MSKYEYRKLIIDKEFKNLIRPLQSAEYAQLEQNICKDGCINPIITWNEIIIDGHNRYEICTRHNIPFTTVKMSFDCREAAIAWICANQLGRRNITEETRKFLIGKQYESEKTVNNKRNALGINQYTYSQQVNPYTNDFSSQKTDPPSKHKTAARIGDEHHISYNTVNKYAAYAKAIDEIGKKVPEAIPQILSGQCKISHENVLTMANYSPKQIKTIVCKTNGSRPSHVHLKNSQQDGNNDRPSPAPVKSLVPTPSIKDMPVFDPDAELISISLTIPSWVNSLNRAKEKTDFKIASHTAKNNLRKNLIDLLQSVQGMLYVIKGK